MTPSNIRALRQHAGLTQRVMAKSLGVSPRTYQDWEGGKAAIPMPAWSLMQIKVALLDQPDLGREVESAVISLPNSEA